jgi:hypothetical protein
LIILIILGEEYKSQSSSLCNFLQVVILVVVIFKNGGRNGIMGSGCSGTFNDTSDFGLKVAGKSFGEP